MSRRLTRSRLSMAAAARELEGSGLGGVVLFAGRVRPDRHGSAVVGALDYEVHLGPAVQAMARIDRETKARFHVARTVLWHRIGRVPVGEIAVIAGAAAGHRAPAFEGARYLIDRLKETVPIWKVEQAPPGRRRPRRRSRRAGRSAG